MVNHSYECPDGHLFDKIVKWDQRYAKCECGKRAERSWASRRVRRFSEPIVLHKYADGQWGVPGRADAATPAGAERIECWHMADYERHLSAMNASERSREQRRHDAGEAMRAEQLQKVREEVKHRLRNASGEWEREMLQLTLERGDASYRPLQFNELRCEALEFDSLRGR